MPKKKTKLKNNTTKLTLTPAQKRVLVECRDKGSVELDGRGQRVLPALKGLVKTAKVEGYDNWVTGTLTKRGEKVAANL